MVSLYQTRVVPVGIILASKAFVNLACGGIVTRNLPNLLDALKEERGKPRERGVLTISNHISVMDDPLLWSMLPTSAFMNSRTTRWVSGAQDICFTNSVYKTFFSAGQVIETDRKGGIFQPAIDFSAKKLGQGDWVHVFPEGRVSQPSLNPKFDEDNMFRFRWGIGRIFLTSPIPPKVVPMHIAGFDKVMPEPRGFPTFLPRPVPPKTLSVSIGSSVDSDKLLLPLWHEWRSLVEAGKIRDDGDGAEERRRRLQVTTILKGLVKGMAIGPTGVPGGKEAKP